MGRSVRFSNNCVPAYVDPRRINPSTTGGDDTAELVAPEEKAASTRGQVLTGKIRLDQYEILVDSHYDGNVVMRWTAYHADKVIREKNLKARRKPLSRSSGLAQQNTLTRCPICHHPVAQKNIQRHLRLVHGQLTLITKHTH